MKIAAMGENSQTTEGKKPVEDNLAVQISQTDSPPPLLQNLIKPDMPPRWCWRRISKCILTIS